MQLIALDKIKADPNNPRKYFDPIKLKDLADSIKEQGVLTDLWVRPAPGVKGEFIIIAGERRFRAAKMVGQDKVPCDVKDWDDKKVAENQIVENLQRDDLSDLEEARAYKRLMETMGYDAKAVAEKIGKSPSYVYSCFRLLKLSPEWQKDLDEGNVKQAFAGVVAARVDKHEDQNEILEELIDGYGFYGNCETADELRKAIEEKHNLALKRAPWNTADAKLHGGACTTCPKRSQAQTEIFGTNKKDDFCTDGACWAKKLSGFEAGLVERYKAEGRTVIEGNKAKEALKKSGQSDFALVKLDSHPSWLSHQHESLRAAAGNKKIDVTLAVDEKGHVHELANLSDVKKAMPTTADPAPAAA